VDEEGFVLRRRTGTVAVADGDHGLRLPIHGLLSAERARSELLQGTNWVAGLVDLRTRVFVYVHQTRVAWRLLLLHSSHVGNEPLLWETEVVAMIKCRCRRSWGVCGEYGEGIVLRELEEAFFVDPLFQRIAGHSLHIRRELNIGSYIICNSLSSLTLALCVCFKQHDPSWQLKQIHSKSTIHSLPVVLIAVFVLLLFQRRKKVLCNLQLRIIWKLRRCIRIERYKLYAHSIALPERPHSPRNQH